MGAPRFVACTPFGVMKLIEERAAAGRRGGGGRRPVEHGRQADGGVAARRGRDRDGLSLEHARPRGDGRRADLLVAAVGLARMIRGDWVKPGAVVIDVGINRTADGKLPATSNTPRPPSAPARSRRARRRRPDDDRDAAANTVQGRADAAGARA